MGLFLQFSGWPLGREAPWLKLKEWIFKDSQTLFHAEQTLGPATDLNEVSVGTVATAHVAFWETEFEGSKGCSSCCWNLAENGGRDARGVKSVSLW